MSEEIAKITFNPETRQIANIAFFRKDLRFRCRRCAVFCCKLGGPRVTEKDLKRLIEAGYEPTDSLAQTAVDKTLQEIEQESVLRSNEDGSCIFLGYDGEGGFYRCSVYDIRPLLCRLYPFEFQQTDPNTVMLRLIPSCSGLNASDGLLVDEGFIKPLWHMLSDGNLLESSMNNSS